MARKKAENLQEKVEMRLPLEEAKLKLIHELFLLKNDAIAHNAEIGWNNVKQEYVQSCEQAGYKVKYYKNSETDELLAIPSIKQIGFEKAEVIDKKHPGPNDVEISAKEFYENWEEEAAILDEITNEMNAQIAFLDSQIESLGGDSGEGDTMLLAYYSAHLVEAMESEDFDYDDDDFEEAEFTHTLNIRKVDRKPLGFSTK